MDRIITRPLRSGKIRAIPSKSAAHRLLICAQMSSLDIKGVCDGLSEDLAATTECLRKIGEASRGGIDPSSVEDAVAEEAEDEVILNCRESGSTLRFLLPLCAAMGQPAYLRGSERLMKRPLAELEEQLTAHGCRITRTPQGIRIRGKLCGGRYDLPGTVSSQYISGLMFVLPLLDEDSEICIDGMLQSRPYVDMTIDALKKSGISIEECETGDAVIYRIRGGQRYGLKTFAIEDVEGDWSNGAFWLAAAELGADIECTGLDPGSLQGDRNILNMIEECRATGEIEIDVGQTPDLVPVIAILAMARDAEDVTRIVNAGRLRMKESDRIESVVAAVNALGGCAKARETEIIITGTGDRKLDPSGPVDSYNDHRIVMMAAIGALLCEGPVEIRGSQAVRKSYPGFFDDYVRLGGEVRSI